MPDTYKNSGAILTSTSETTVYTVPSNTTAIVNSIILANVDNTYTNTVDATVKWYDSSASTLYTLLNAWRISGAGGQAIVTPGAALVLEAGDQIRVTASVANRLHVTVNVLEKS